MDALPNELIVNILSFLDGKYVVRFKLLNRRFQQIINKNRGTIRFPRFNLTIVTHPTDDKKIELHLQNEWTRVLDLSTPSISISSMKNAYFDAVYYHTSFSFLNGSHIKFFNQLFTRNSVFRPEINFRDLMFYIFEKIDVERLSCWSLDDVGDSESFSVIHEVVKKSPVAIQEVQVSLGAPLFTEVCDLLTTVANRNCKASPKMKLLFPDQTGREIWPRLVKINEIASSYQKVLIECVYEQMPQVMSEIAVAWIEDPIPTFNFAFSLPSWFDEPEPFELRRVDQRFEITHYKSEYLRLHSRENASVDFRDRKTKNSLRFYKKNGQEMHYDNNLVKRKTVNIYVDVHIES